MNIIQFQWIIYILKMYLSRGKYIFNELFIYFYNMDEKIDLISFLGRIKMTQAELARRIETTPGNVNRWAKREGVPGYDLCRKLLLLGMTVEELFGIDYNVGKIQPQSPPPEFVNDPKFQEGVKFLVEETLKAKGYR